MGIIKKNYVNTLYVFSQETKLNQLMVCTEENENLYNEQGFYRRKLLDKESQKNSFTNTTIYWKIMIASTQLRT